jgi:hypothetical protein
VGLRRERAFAGFRRFENVHAFFVSGGSQKRLTPKAPPALSPVRVIVPQNDFDDNLPQSPAHTYKILATEIDA